MSARIEVGKFLRRTARRVSALPLQRGLIVLRFQCLVHNGRQLPDEAGGHYDRNFVERYYFRDEAASGPCEATVGEADGGKKKYN